MKTIALALAAVLGRPHTPASARTAAPGQPLAKPAAFWGSALLEPLELLEFLEFPGLHDLRGGYLQLLSQPCLRYPVLGQDESEGGTFGFPVKP